VSPLLAEDRFHAWSAQHYLLMLATVAGAAGLVWWGRRHGGSPSEVVARRAFAVVLLLVAATMQAYSLTPGIRDVRDSWPLQLSDLADYAAAFALWTRGPRTAAFTYYVGLTLTLSAIVTPALTEPFPDVQWFGFWLRHILVVWAAVYLVWGLGIRPTWRVYRTTVAAVLVWAVVAYTFDVATGANYGYLVDTPAVTTPLDLLGPWPWYVLAAMALLLGGWAVVMTLPWERARRRRSTPAGSWEPGRSAPGRRGGASGA
jgi:hypothetical integral membrane protein (TIGR02206 family)